MPNIKSKIKRVKISQKENADNTSKRSRIKNSIKKFDAAIEANDTVVAKELLTKITSLLDRAWSDGVYHKNTVARKKSALARQFNSISK